MAEIGIFQRGCLIAKCGPLPMDEGLGPNRKLVHTVEPRLTLAANDFVACERDVFRVAHVNATGVAFAENKVVAEDDVFVEIRGGGV